MINSQTKRNNVVARDLSKFTVFLTPRFTHYQRTLLSTGIQSVTETWFEKENIRQSSSLKCIDKKNVSENCYCLVINMIHHTICFISVVYFVVSLTNWSINEIVTNRIHFYFLLSTNKFSYTFPNFFPNNLREETIFFLVSFIWK